jgi:amino acid transporter
MFKVLFAYNGWQNANYVLNDVKNPVRTLKVAGPLGLGITATLYIFANIAYFAYVHHALDKRLLTNAIYTARLQRLPYWSLTQQ